MIDPFHNTMRKKYLSPEEREQICERNLTGLPRSGRLRKHELARRLAKTGYVKDTYRIHRDSQLIAVKDKVHRIVEKFKADGLTAKDFVEAGERFPQILIQNPDTTERNIRAVVQHCQRDGLTCRVYLTTALRCPRLFCSSAETVVSKIRRFQDMFQKQYIQFSLEDFYTAQEQQLDMVLFYLLQHPQILVLPDPNFFLFEFHTKILGTPVLLHRTIRAMEESLSAFYDSSQNKRVEKYEEGNGFTDFGMEDPRFEPWAKNLALRALIRARIIQQARIIG
jgi:hypothetical protein